MRHRALAAFLVAFAFSVCVPPAVSSCCFYEPDPRLEPFVPTLFAMAEADSLIVPGELLSYQPGDGTYRMEVAPWTDLQYRGIYYPACRLRDYHGQPTPLSGGGGVLVGQDLVLTAAHLVADNQGTWCQTLGFVFGYGNFSFNNQWQVTCDGTGCWVTIPEDDVYACEEVHYSLTEDWAVVRLDRMVTGRNPLPIRTDPTPPDLDTDITVVGHPNHIPMKVEHGEITNIYSNVFYGISGHMLTGSSGSMVVEDATGEVVGIVTAGPGAIDLGCEPSVAPCWRECFSIPVTAGVRPAYLAADYIPEFFLSVPEF